MSSEHIIIVARNNRTGEIQLPMDDTTLYMSGGLDETGIGSPESILQSCRAQFTDDWVLAVYRPSGDFYCGSKP